MDYFLYVFSDPPAGQCSHSATICGLTYGPQKYLRSLESPPKLEVSDRKLINYIDLNFVKHSTLKMPLTPQSTYTLNNGVKIPVIALGVYKTENNVAKDVVYDALEAGYRHFDSAELYGNEAEVGEGIAKWLKDTGTDRSEIFYTTKIYDTHQGYEEAKKQIDVSLDRVKALGYIDLILIHSPLTSKKKRLGTWKALQEAVNEGKVKSIGVSNFGIHHLKELLSWEGLEIKPVTDQVELSPWLTREELDKYCKSEDILLQAYCPLTRCEKFGDATLVKLSEKYGKSPAQILIRWSLQKGFNVLPKSGNKKRLVQNLDVFDFEILGEDINALSQPGAKESFAGWAADPLEFKDDDEAEYREI